MQKLGTYQNGNYQVTIFDDGTKIRENNLDFFEPEFPESIDMKITNYCDRNCPYCHENSNISGAHAMFQASFLGTLKPFTEIAIGGGNPLSHPELKNLLLYFRFRKIITSMTVNQVHFENNLELINELVSNRLIYGLGVSLVNITDDFISSIKQFDNAVLHVINGITTIDEIKTLANNQLKILILGYKQHTGRGKDFYSNNIEKRKTELYNFLPHIIDKFKVISFDNLAIEQLNIKRLLNEKQWNEFYMGNDGQFTMYIDLVNRRFAKSSTSESKFDLLSSINEMFNFIIENN